MLRWVLRRSGKDAVGIVLASLCASAVSVALIAVVHRALSAPDPRQWLGWFALAASARLGTNYVSGRLAIAQDKRLLHTLRRTVAERVLNTPLTKLEEVGRARILTHLTADIGTLQAALPVLTGLLTSAAVAFGGCAYMAYLSPGALFIFGVLGLLSFVIHRKTQAQAASHFRAALQFREELQSHIQDLVNGVKELGLSPEKRHSLLEEGFVRTSEQDGQASQRGRLAYVRAQALGQAPAMVAVLALLAGFASENDSPADTSGFILAALYVAGPLSSLLRAGGPWSSASIAFARIQATLGSLEPHAPLAKRCYAPPRPLDTGKTTAFTGLHLSQVTCRRSGSKDDFELGPIELSITPGKVLFITGENGSGKSTLALLISGLLAPSTGKVMALQDDDAPPGPVQGPQGSQPTFPETYVGAVFSNYHLPARPWGLTAAQQARLGALLSELDLDEVIGPQTFSVETPLPSSRLSQGQQRRLALALCLAENRPLLIFDEFAADQDPGHKEWFYRILLPRLKAQGKAVVVVTHDDRYFSLADQQVHLLAGQMISLGNQPTE